MNRRLTIAQAARRAITAMLVAAAASAMRVPTAEARGGGHGHDGGIGESGMHGGHFAGGKRRGNDSYIKAASDEKDRLLNTRLKSICRGC
jgi:hypothetical protein